jgi:predicted Fe-Mo cluster-binding NifX family protein
MIAFNGTILRDAKKSRFGEAARFAVTNPTDGLLRKLTISRKPHGEEEASARATN